MDFSAVVYVIANKIYIQVCMEHLKVMEIKLYTSFVFQIRLTYYLCLSLNNIRYKHLSHFENLRTLFYILCKGGLKADNNCE